MLMLALLASKPTTNLAFPSIHPEKNQLGSAGNMAGLFSFRAVVFKESHETG
jgi:hypothetical protein